MKAMLLLQPGRLDILHMNTVCIVRTVFEERAVDVMSPCKSRHVSRGFATNRQSLHLAINRIFPTKLHTENPFSLCR